MLRSLFSSEHIGNVWFALSAGLLSFILSYGLARAEIIPPLAGSAAPPQVVVQAPPPPPPPVVQAPVLQKAPGCIPG